MAVALVKEDRLELRAPFHGGVPYRCRGLSGRWKGVDVGCVFEREHDDAVRVICLDLFDLDGHPESLEDTVDLEVTVEAGYGSLPVPLPGEPA